MEQFLKFVTRNRQLITMSVLCVVTIGVGGWYLLSEREAAKEAAAPVEMVQDPVVRPAVPKEPEPIPVPEPEVPAPVVAEEAPPPVVKPVLDDTPIVAEAPKLVVSPLNGTVLAAFSVDELIYSETFDDWRTHDGVDIAAAAGTTVLSASAGTVLSVRADDMMGTTVTIDHGDGYQTTYANLQAKPTVEAGDSVSAGQIIGAVGTTAAAESAQGPHLHFSVTLDGDAVDPNEYLDR